MSQCRFLETQEFNHQVHAVCLKRGRTAERACFLPTGERGSWSGNEMNIPQAMFCLAAGDIKRCQNAEQTADPVQVLSGLNLRGCI